MVTRRTFMASGAGALAAMAAGSSAFAALAVPAAPAQGVTIVSAGMVAAPSAVLVQLGADRLRNLAQLRQTLAQYEGAELQLSLDAADQLLLEIVASDLGQAQRVASFSAASVKTAAAGRANLRAGA